MSGVHDFIERHRDLPFEWGKNDCLAFVEKGLVAQGVVPPDNVTYYKYESEFGAYKNYLILIRQHNVQDILGFFDKYYPRCNHIPPKGSLVAKRDNGSTTGYTFGFTDGRNGFFPDWDGIKSIRLDPEGDIYWLVE